MWLISINVVTSDVMVSVGSFCIPTPMLLILRLRALIADTFLPVEGTEALGGGHGATVWSEKDKSLENSAKTAVDTS